MDGGRGGEGGGGRGEGVEKGRREGTEEKRRVGDGVSGVEGMIWRFCGMAAFVGI